MTQEAADTLYELYIKKVVQQVDYCNQSKKDREDDPNSEGICFALDFVDMECEILSDILRGKWCDALERIGVWECDGGLRDNYVEVFDKIVEDSQNPDFPHNLLFKVQGKNREDFDVRSDIPDQAYKMMYDGLAQTNKLIKTLRCLCLIGLAKMANGDGSINDGDLITCRCANGYEMEWRVDYDGLERFDWS